MYIEFIIIYVLLAIILALTVVNTILILKRPKGSGAVKNVEPSRPKVEYSDASPSPTTAAPSYNPNQGEAVAFCVQCATQYPATEKYCPKCGTPRS